MVEIFYIPGLNTYGDGQIHVGPFRFGQMHSQISQALLKHDVRLVCYDNLAYGTIDEHVDRILKSNNQFKPNTILAHSTGGLIARALAHHTEFTAGIKRIITIATPHAGTPLAERALHLTEQKRLLSTVTRMFGYNIKEKLKFFEELTPQALKKFNKLYPDKDSITYYSIATAPKVSDLELPFRLLQSLAGLKFDSVERFDGIIPYESQKWGVPLGNFELDHLAQIGFFRHIVSKRKRNSARLQFEQMMSLVGTLVKS